jgi:uncharacterized protein (TIGR02594 family)
MQWRVKAACGIVLAISFSSLMLIAAAESRPAIKSSHERSAQAARGARQVAVPLPRPNPQARPKPNARVAVAARTHQVSATAAKPQRSHAAAIHRIYALRQEPATRPSQPAYISLRTDRTRGTGVYARPYVQERAPAAAASATGANNTRTGEIADLLARVAALLPASSPTNALIAEARRYIGTNPTGRARLWCARFLNFVLQRLGKEGTNSDAAKSFASYGRRLPGPQVGAIAVMSRGKRGGHVGIVTGFDKSGNIIVLSGNHGKIGVGEGTYPRNRIYAYVMP